MTVILIIVAVYVAAFLVLMILGRSKNWDTGYAFRYSDNRRLDWWLGLLFAPAYWLVHLFGIERLHAPWPMPD